MSAKKRKNYFCWSTIFFILVFFTGIFINVAYTLEANKSENLALKDIVFVILTQQNTYHRERAKVFKKDFYAQLKNISKATCEASSNHNLQVKDYYPNQCPVLSLNETDVFHQS